MNSISGDLLIVDDTPENLRFLSATLSQHGYKVRSVTNGQMALNVARSASPSLILLDIRMPDMDGYEVCQQLKAEDKTSNIPIIFLSALDEPLDKVKAFKSGGADYITKPFQIEEVLARIENQLQLQIAQAEIRQLNQELEQRVRQRTLQLEQEIAERRRAQDQLLHLALHDDLTGLPNRIWFLSRLTQVFSRSQEGFNHRFAVLLLDCDRFKIVNDSLGHLFGDQLLVSVARRLESCLHPIDTLARLGGDEFVILLEDIDDADEAIAVGQKLQQEMLLPFQLDKHRIFATASIGIVLGAEQYTQPEHLLRDADTAMYQAKAKGKSSIQLFEPEMYHHAQKRLTLETELQLALEHQEFLVYYQPVVSLPEQRVDKFEALVRWQHPQRGLIAAGHFIQVAEETGLIIPIDILVLRQACKQLHSWHQWAKQSSFKTLPGLSFNLSVRQFNHPNLITQIDEILHDCKIDGQYLTLEITERALVGDTETVMTTLQDLKKRHIRLSIDDFGTGYSCLSYLSRLPVDNLKIDRSFVNAMENSGQDISIIQAIVTLAHQLGMTVTAEGIETPAQLAHLINLNCQYGQGFFFSPPVDAKNAMSSFSA